MTDQLIDLYIVGFSAIAVSALVIALHEDRIRAWVRNRKRRHHG